jgi:hypothetical protein
MCKIEHFSSADCRIIDNHEGQEAYSQTGTSCPLPGWWRRTGRVGLFDQSLEALNCQQQ